jgi:hypothetical protein
MTNEYAAVGKMRIGRKTESSQRKPTLMPLATNATSTAQDLPQSAKVGSLQK